MRRRASRPVGVPCAPPCLHSRGQYRGPSYQSCSRPVVPRGPDQAPRGKARSMGRRPRSSTGPARAHHWLPTYRSHGAVPRARAPHHCQSNTARPREARPTGSGATRSFPPLSPGYGRRCGHPENAPQHWPARSAGQQSYPCPHRPTGCRE